MKQTITTQHGTSCWRRKKLYGLILAFLLAGIGLQAQTASFETGYPKLSPSTLTVLGDPGYVDVYFTPTLAAITTPKLEVKLPANINYVGVETGTGHTASITYGTPSVTGTVAAGQTVTIPFSSTLNTGAAVFLRIKVTALCGAVNGATVTVKVLSNSTAITTVPTNTNLLVGVQTPTIRVTSAAPTQIYASQTDLKDFELSLDAQNGVASSFILTLTGDQYTTLSNFTLDGTSITPTTLNVVSGSTSKTTITLTTAEMGGNLGTTVKKLKFKAGNTRCGARNIATSAQYPAASSCSTQTGVALTMSLPSVPGTTVLTHVKSSYYDPGTGNDRSIWQIPLDGVTTAKIYQIYKNSGSADAYDLQLMLYPSYSTYSYVDTTDVYYSIDNGPEKKATNDMFVVETTTSATNSKIRTLTTTAEGQPFRVALKIPDVLPAGKEVKVRWGAFIGKIYDNTGKTAWYEVTTQLGGLGIGASANNKCGVAGSNIVPTQSVVANMAPPMFMELPQSLSFREGESVEHKLKMFTGNDLLTSRGSSTDVYIKLPSWMSLDGLIQDAVKLGNYDGSFYASPVSTTDHGNGLYSLRYQNATPTWSMTGWLQVKLKAGACQSSLANTDSVATYWMDYNPNNGTDPLRPSLKCISQVYQSLTMLCKKDGLVLDGFNVTRTTKGLKDSDNDSRPDDGTAALDTEIDHNSFMVNDSGYLTWKGHIDGTSANIYKNIYASLTSEDMTFGSGANLQFDGTQAKIVIDGTTYPIAYTLVDNKNLYLRYNDEVSNTIKGGAIFEIQLPFKAITYTGSTKYSIAGEAYVSNIAEANPLQPTQRHGEDKFMTTVGVYTTNQWNGYWGGDQQVVYCPNAGVYTVSNGMDIFHNSYLPAPYFKNEYRNLRFHKKAIYTLPEGYFIEGVTIKLTARDSSYTRTRMVVPESVNGNVYTYDFSQFYDPAYDGSGTLAPGLWMLPDDKFTLTYEVKLRATHAAALGSSSVKQQIIYDDNIVGGAKNVVVTGYSQLIYSGAAVSLNLSTNTLPAYGANMTIPVVTVGNPSGSTALNDVWLYVVGNVSNIKITPTGGGATINGEGFEGRWIKVSNLMAAGAALPYKMDFTYGGSNDCSTSDKVTVYTVSGFENPWTAPTGAAFDITDFDHLGVSKDLTITAAPAKIVGGLSVSNTTLSYNSEYTLTAIIDARSSQGALKNPQIKLTIPAGQKYTYTTNSAKVEYPLGTTPVAVPAALETALRALDSTGESTITLDLGPNFLLSGYLSAGTDNDRQMKFTMNFAPQCETELTGIHFTGELFGSSACGDIANGNATQVFSQQMLPNLASSYVFDVTSAIADNNKAFNELRTTGIWKVTIKKLTGATDNMTAGDFLQLTLPKQFNISGTASITSGLGVGSVTTQSNTVSGNNREIVLSLPIAAYDAAVSKGIGTEVVYEIPVVYTPSGQDLAPNPGQNLIATVTTNRQLDASCPSKPANIGTGSLGIAVLTANAAPYLVCLNTVASPEITSAGFDGKWYDTSTRTTVLASTPVYTYTPTVQANSTFYVSASINGVDYGTVPVQVNLNPEATITVTNPAAICVGSSVNLTTAVSGTPAGSSVAYFESDQTTVVTDPIGIILSATTTYYAQVTTIAGCQSAKTAINVTVSQLPVLTLSKTSESICSGNPYNLNTLVSSITPSTCNLKCYTDLNCTQSQAISVTASGTYYLRAENSATGCQSVAQAVTITLKTPPVVTITPPSSSVYVGEAINYSTESGMSNYVWSATNGTVSSTSSTAAVTWGSVGTGSVTVSYDNAEGCPGSHTLNVSVNAQGSPAITGTSSVCKGATTVTYSTASGMVDYTWTVSAGGTITAGAGTNEITVTWDSSTQTGNQVSVKYKATSGSPFTSVSNFGVEVKQAPSVAAISGAASYCLGSQLNLTTPALTTQGSAITTQGWLLDGVSITMPYNLTAADNGKILKYSASCDCSLTGYSNEITLAVGTTATVGTITAPTTVCAGSVLSLTVPTVTANGSPITTQGWMLDNVAITTPYTPTYADNGKTLKYFTTTACGTVYSNDVIISVMDKPTITNVPTTIAAFCAGTSLSLTSPTVTYNGSAKVKETWRLNGSDIDLSSYLFTNADNGKSLTYYAENACGSTTSTAVTLGVTQLVSVTTHPTLTSPVLAPGVKIPFGTPFTISGLATSGTVTGYQWYRNGVAIAGETNATLTKAAVAGDRGNYKVRVIGACNYVESNDVFVLVANDDATLKDLSVDGNTVSGFNPQVLSYQYYIACDMDKAVLGAVPNDVNATLTPASPSTVSLLPGDNYFTFTVTAEDGVTTKIYTVNVVRDCYVPRIKKDLDDAVICLNGSHTWEIEAEGENLTYEWYKGEKRIMGQNSPSITFTDAQFSDYDRYYVVVRSNHNGFKSSIQSKKVRLWVADYLPEHLRLAEYPNPATVGKTSHIKVDGYIDVTKYIWSYSKDGVTFSPAVTLYNDNETWATFGTLSAGNGILKVTMEHPCGTRELTQAITVNYPTGVEDVTAKVVTVYPNPTSGMLKVSGTVANQMIRVTDVTGSLKGSYKTQEGITTIDLTGYAKGTYLVQYNGKAYKVIRK